MEIVTIRDRLYFKIPNEEAARAMLNHIEKCYPKEWNIVSERITFQDVDYHCVEDFEGWDGQLFIPIVFSLQEVVEKLME